MPAVLPKAYLRLDPNIDQTHPDPGAMVRLLCAANRQPQRGRFKTRALLQSILTKRTSDLLVARGDVVPLDDGRWYVDGWDEWQEGDWTVGERQRRIRAKRNGGITEPALHGNGASVTEPLPERSSTPRRKALGVKTYEEDSFKRYPERARARSGLEPIAAVMQRKGLLP